MSVYPQTKQGAVGGGGRGKGVDVTSPQDLSQNQDDECEPGHGQSQDDPLDGGVNGAPGPNQAICGEDPAAD